MQERGIIEYNEEFANCANEFFPHFWQEYLIIEKPAAEKKSEHSTVRTKNPKHSMTMRKKQTHEGVFVTIHCPAPGPILLTLLIFF